MPTYDYKCSKCQYITEIDKPMSDNSKQLCPKCKEEMHKTFRQVMVNIWECRMHKGKRD